MEHDKMDHNSPPQQPDMAGMSGESHSMHHMHEHDAHNAPTEPSAHSGHNMEGMHSGHGEHAGHSEEMFKRPFWISLVLTIPVLLYSDLLRRARLHSARISGLAILERGAGQYHLLVWRLGLPHGCARRASRARQPGMMTLVSLAPSAPPTSTAWPSPLAGSARDVVLLGARDPRHHHAAGPLDGDARRRTAPRARCNELAKLLPDMAERITDGRAGNGARRRTRRWRPGAGASGRIQVPADGDRRGRESSVNESMITGESRPVDKAPGAEVIGGHRERERLATGAHQHGRASRRCSRASCDSLPEAQSSQTRAQALADRAAYWLTLSPSVYALVTLIVWADRPRRWRLSPLERVVTVLVVACPHALGLAIPLVIAISTTLSARNGILVRDRLALEDARNLNVVVFDKTGTLTLGEQGLVGVASVRLASTRQSALALAAAVEADSEHPIARALSSPPQAARPGYPARDGIPGATGTWRPGEVAGSHAGKSAGHDCWNRRQIALPDALTQQEQLPGASAARRVIYLRRGLDRSLAAFALADVIRPESSEGRHTARGRACAWRCSRATARTRCPLGSGRARHHGILRPGASHSIRATG